MDENTQLTLGAELEDVVAAVERLRSQPVFGAVLNLLRTLERRENPQGYYSTVQSGPIYLYSKSSDIIINIEGFDEPIELERLRRTVSNCANALKKFDDKNLVGGVRENYLVRCRDSLDALNLLLKGDQVSSPFSDALNEINSESTSDKEENITFPVSDIREERYAVALGIIYGQVKNIQAICAAKSLYNLNNMCIDVMQYIRRLSRQENKND